MKASELRIGNWVSQFDKPVKVVSVSSDNGEDMEGVNVRGGWDGELIADIDMEDTHPVPLTPEIFDNGMDLISEKLSHSIADEIADIVDIRDWPLHRYQNLIFALTGTELEINL